MFNELVKIVGESYARIGRPKRVLLALSGGADSVLLFRLLVTLQESCDFLLKCIHVNHGLRAEASDDVAFVQNLCVLYGVPLAVVHVQVQGERNVEASARAARHAALKEEAQSWGADAIALAHHQDDQAETVLLRLLHGTGSQGLSAMREWLDSLWRPLLAVRSADIQRVLMRLGQNWVTDASNADLRFTRNRIRAEVIPALERISTAAVANAARTSEILAAESDYWIEYATSWLAEYASLHPACMYLRIQPLVQMHTAAQRQVLRRMCEEASVQLEFSQLERLRTLMYEPKGSVLNLPLCIRAMRGREHIFFESEVDETLPLGVLKECDTMPINQRVGMAETFDVDKVSGAVLRYREAGDIISPLGAPGSKKLKDYLIDRKVDRPFRKHWPIYCKGNTVLWVPGVGMSQDAAICNATAKRVHLQYVGRLPDEYIGWGGKA